MLNRQKSAQSSSLSLSISLCLSLLSFCLSFFPSFLFSLSLSLSLFLSLCLILSLSLLFNPLTSLKVELSDLPFVHPLSRDRMVGRCIPAALWGGTWGRPAGKGVDRWCWFCELGNDKGTETDLLGLKQVHGQLCAGVVVMGVKPGRERAMTLWEWPALQQDLPISHFSTLKTWFELVIAFAEMPRRHAYEEQAYPFFDEGEEVIAWDKVKCIDVTIDELSDTAEQIELQVFCCDDVCPACIWAKAYGLQS